MIPFQEPASRLRPNRIRFAQVLVQQLFDTAAELVQGALLRFTFRFEGAKVEPFC